MQYIYSQRLKRLESIVDKIANRGTFRLSKLQDIGGSRVILSNLDNVYKFYNNIKENSDIHIKDEVDYIKNPRESGYRGIHLIIEDKDEGLVTELQIRTQLEHIWATAVETAGLAIGHELKFGRGDTDWLDMFAYMSKIMANDEGANNNIEEYKNRIIDLNNKNDFMAKLEVLRNFTQLTETLKTNFGLWDCFILLMNLENKEFSLIPYAKGEYEKAYNTYKELESEEKNVVLVKTNSIFNLKEAYPNYFADMSQFLNYFNNLIS